MVNKPLFLGGARYGGGRLTSHKISHLECSTWQPWEAGCRVWFVSPHSDRWNITMFSRKLLCLIGKSPLFIGDTLASFMVVFLLSC